MSNVIQFLESMARDPSSVGVTPGEYQRAVEGIDTDAITRDALLRRDAITLNRLLGGRAEMWCMVATPGEEQPLRSPEEPDGDEGQEPDDVPDR